MRTTLTLLQFFVADHLIGKKVVQNESMKHENIENCVLKLLQSKTQKKNARVLGGGFFFTKTNGDSSLKLENAGDAPLQFVHGRSGSKQLVVGGVFVAVQCSCTVQ